MAGRKKSPLWRQAFLRALRRTGNVRASAFEAGVDPGTAYDHRVKDAGFRGKWGAALAAYKKKPSPQPSPASGRGGKEELVVRRTRQGDKLVRASPGRWSARVEESFLDALEETGCVRTSAASVEMSTQAFYARRDKYPEFRARWDDRVGRFREQLPGLINAAAVEAVSPRPGGGKRRGRARLPKLSGGEAVRVYAINENSKARAGGRGSAAGAGESERLRVTEAELNESIMRKLALLDRRNRQKRLASGWTELGDGLWLPPGWAATPPEGWTPTPAEDTRADGQLKAACARPESA